MEFIDTSKLAQVFDRPFTYYLKEPTLCKVYYIKDGANIESEGILKLVEPSNGNIYDKLSLENEEGIIILEKDEVKMIESR